MVGAALTAIAMPAAAQHWSFDARRIAIGGTGASNPSSKLVEERRSYGTVVLPFGLLQSLSDLDVYRSLLDPGDPTYDPIRALELLVSPLHYTFARPHQPTLRGFVHDLANNELSRDFGIYGEIELPDRIFWEGLAAPNWGKTFVVSGDREGFFHGVYVGAGPYFSGRTDTGIDPNMIQTLARFALDDSLPGNASFNSSHATTIQAAAALTGGYRGRFPLAGGGAYERDGIYIAADYHYLYGFRMAQAEGDLNFTTDEAGLVVVGDAGSRYVGFYDIATSQSGRGLAVDAGATVVMGRVEIGFGARGLGNRLEWSGLEYERDTIELETDEPGSPGSPPSPASGFEGLGSALPDALRIELPVHYTADVGYHADGWSAMAEYGHGLLGHRVNAGVELRRGWIELRGGGRFVRDRWHPSVGVGFNRSAGPSFDVALFGGSANVARKRSMAIAASLRLNATTLFGG